MARSANYIFRRRPIAATLRSNAFAIPFLGRSDHPSVHSRPCVWAIDEEHAPSYWFPRDCPRACCWKARDKSLTSAGAALLGLGGANRLHAIESAWLQRTRDCRLYVYEFDSTPFRMKVPDAGYWVTDQEVTPRSVSPVGDLLKRHVEAEIELRVVEFLLESD